MLKIPEFGKRENLLIRGAKGIPNRIHAQKSTPRFIITKRRKTKDKEKNLESIERRMMHHLWENHDSNGSRFRIGIPDSRRISQH